MYRKISKKGALELSMNTIVIIVIGVTLLILGLAFVRGIFGKVTKLSEGAFEQAEGKIGDLSTTDKPLTITPEKIALKKGESKIVVAILANRGTKETSAVATVTSKSSAEDIKCTFQETESAKSDTIKIPSGEFRTAKILVESIPSTGTTGNKVCKVTTTGLGESIQDTLAIVVEA